LNPKDDVGHGTSVSAIVHVSAPKATIVSIRVLDSQGYTTMGNLLLGLEKAITLRCHVINLSLGSEPFCLSPLCFILQLIAPITVQVCAAGNSGPKSGTIAMPAHCPSTIAVGSVSGKIKPGDPAWFSSRGPVCGMVLPDISALGGYGDKEGITQPIERLVVPSVGGEEALARGTSFSAPWISGVIALLIQYFGRIPDRGLVESQMNLMALDLGNPGKDNETGYGLIQANSLLYLPKIYDIASLIRETFKIR